MTIKILTLNLLSGAARWERRLPLIVDGLKQLAPQVIAVQEVSLPAGDRLDGNPAEQIAAAIGYAHLTLCRKTDKRGDEAIAFISRLPLLEPECLHLGGQNRVAQRAIVEIEGQKIVIANAHLFWQPGDSRERLRQVERIIDWIGSLPGEPPAVICGDFNGAPETRALRRMQPAYVSAYAAVHGREPERTFPTPLKRSRLEMLLGILGLLIYIRPQPFKLSLASTLDYIFVDRRLHVAGCRRVFDQPAPGDPDLYPSDHYGLLAEIDLT